MTITQECPQCRKQLAAPDSAAGKSLKCPHCSEPVMVPYMTQDNATHTSDRRKACPFCAELIAESAIKCRFCGSMLSTTQGAASHAAHDRKSIGDNVAIRMILPVGRSGLAIAAGYLGLLSVLIIPAPFAVLTGILAIWQIRCDPKKHGMGRAIFGIVMGGIVIITTVMLIGIISLANSR